MHAFENFCALSGRFASAAGRTTGLFVLILLFLSGPAAMAQGPEIEVLASGTSVPNNGSVNYGVVSVGGGSTKTFTIRNTGTSQLLALYVAKSGTNAVDFTHTQPPVNFLWPGTATTFTVTFRPSQAGGRSALLRISSSDADEDPYNINLSGNGGGGTPEITVTRGGVTLTDGSSTVNFGNVRVGITDSRTITIRNSGSGSLSNLDVIIVGGGGFSAAPLSVTSLGGGASTTFDVTFNPPGESQSTASLQIFSNDANENPFDIELRGTGFVPFMEVDQQPEGTPLNDETSIIDFGTTDPGLAVQKTFTLRNVSNGMLTGLVLLKDGSHPGDFHFGALSSTSLASGESMTFTVSFNPAAPGDRTAAIHLSSDQSAANPFDIDVKGVGTTLSDLGDADGDGTVNMVENATAGDPLTPGPAPGVLTMNGATLEFTFSKKVAALFEVAFTVEWTDDLALWNGTPEVNATILSDDGTVQVVRYTLSAGPNGNRFMRLRVSRP